MATRTTAARRTWGVLLATCVLGTLLGFAAATVEGISPTTPTASAAPTEGASFTPLATPCRAVDTRNQPAGRIAGATAPNPFGSRSFQIGGTNIAGQGGTTGGCGVPDAASAVEVTVTVTGALADGFLRVAPNNGTTPATAFINYRAGASITNTGTVTLSTTQLADLTVFNFSPAGTHVLIDVQGYFSSIPDMGYTPLATPCRAVDTRNQPAGRIAGATAPDPFGFRAFQIAGDNISGQGGATGGCRIPTGVNAVEITVTVTGALADGFLRVAPNSGITPTAAFVNYQAGVSITNTGTVTLSTAQLQDLAVFNFSPAGTHVLIDVQGFISPSSTLGYTPLTTPCRAVDTRNQPAGRIAGATAPNPFGSRSFQISGSNISGQGGAAGGCGIPDGAQAVEITVTVTGALADGFLRIAPNNGTTPTAAFINYRAGIGISNTGTVTLGRLPLVNGALDLSVFNFSAAGTHVLIDVQGYFSGDARPFVNNLEPSTAPAAGGTAIQIAGANFTGATGVTFGGTPAQLFSVVSDHLITAVTPPGTGTVVVLVTNPKGTALSTSTTEFTYTGGPIITRLSSTDGPSDGGEEIDIIGANLDAVSGVTFGGAPTVFARISPTLIRAVAPPGGGSVDVRVSASGVTSAVTAASRYTYLDSLAVGGQHACAIVVQDREDSRLVRCWGSNERGQLGNPTTSDLASRLVIGESGGRLTGAVQVTAGDQHTCARLENGQARCWGRNDLGQLGTNTTTSSPRPVTVSGVGGSGSLTKVLQLSAGGTHTCAVMTNLTARCWGLNNNGQLGDGTSTTRLSPVVVGGATPLTGVVQITAGQGHTCALLTSGEARCWGANGSGAVGDGTTSQRRLPATVGGSTPLGGIQEISAGDAFTCAVLTSSEGRCWGAATSSQLGNGGSANSTTPVVIGGGTPLTGIRKISAGDGHACVSLFTQRRTECWGLNSSGQLGVGVFTVSNGSPVTVDLPAFRLGTAQVDVGGFGSCVVGDTGTSSARLANCWGNNDDGQVGDGSITDRSSPVEVAGFSGATQLSAGTAHTCVALADLNASCWGGNSSGQLGINGLSDSTTPVTVNAVGGGEQLGGVVQVSSGAGHSCALLITGQARCWGLNASGQLGDGTTTRRLAPVVVGGATPLTGIIQIEAGSFHTCAVLASGQVRCWGANGNGQLGDGTLTDRSTPVTVRAVGGGAALTGATMVAAGSDHSCAGLDVGQARCWGLGGLTGDGTTTRRTTPVNVQAVGGGSSLIDIIGLSAGSGHTCATLTNGRARCWGFNNVGQLGDATTVDRRTPVAVSGSGAGGVVGEIGQVGAGLNHSCAAVNGGARCWGTNGNGRLGNGSTINSSVPTAVQQVGGGSVLAGVAQTDGGGSHSCATTNTGAVRCWGFNSNGQLGNGSTVQSTVPVEVSGLP
jgi:alpha-tubulin suppressor-like RCC1 family protein